MNSNLSPLFTTHPSINHQAREKGKKKKGKLTNQTSTYNPDSHHHSTAADTAHHTGDKFHESASGLKGLVAAVHGAGESLRGNINAEIDRLFHDVLSPPFSPLPLHARLTTRKTENGRGAE